MQNSKLYVGNLPYSATELELEELFSQCGEVVEVKLIVDAESNRPKGFGFVEMSTVEEAEDAIEKLDGYSLQGRNIRVDKARPRRDRNNRGGGRRY